MLKAYLRVIHASLILTDMRRYHTQLSMVTSNIDMISVIFIRDKSLKLHASVSIHTTGISAGDESMMISYLHSIIDQYCTLYSYLRYYVCT